MPTQKNHRTRSLLPRRRYKLDQGDGEGLQDFEDDEHVAASRDGRFYGGEPGPVAAAGSTPFGRFVSLGVITEEKQEEAPSIFTLTLARRYVDEADPRSEWTTPLRVFEGLGDDEAFDVADLPSRLPWKMSGDVSN